MGKILRMPAWVARPVEAFIRAEPETRSGAITPDEDRRPEIGRGRLTSFRRFRVIDSSELLLWGRHSDPLLESYNMLLRSPEEARQWFHTRESFSDAQLFAVDSLSERRVVGYIGLREIDSFRRTSVLGISFDPATVGLGYGSDSLLSFLDYYFRSWKYESMFLDVAAPNARAQRCYEKCGYEYTGQRWKPYTGNAKNAMRSDAMREHPEMFQMRGRGLSMLYYDMLITREGWMIRTQRD